MTLLLNSAISTSKPVQLPMWDKFIEATSTMQDREVRPRIYAVKLPTTGTQGDYAQMRGQMDSILVNINKRHIILQKCDRY